MTHWVEIAGPVAGVIGSISAVVSGWYFNEKSRRQEEEYKHREQKYVKLMSNLPSFYENITEKDKPIEEMKDEFIEQVYLLWLYAPDHVIHKANALLSVLKPENQTSYTQKKAALFDLIRALRADLIKKEIVTATHLKEKDLELWISVKKGNTINVDVGKLPSPSKKRS